MIYNTTINIVRRTTNNIKGKATVTDTPLFDKPVPAYVSTVNNLESIIENSERVDDVRLVNTPIPITHSKQILITDIVLMDGLEFQIAAQPRRYDFFCNLTIRRKV